MSEYVGSWSKMACFIAVDSMVWVVWERIQNEFNVYLPADCNEYAKGTPGSIVFVVVEGPICLTQIFL